LRQAWRAKTPRINARRIPPTRTTREIREQATAALANLARNGGGLMSTNAVCDRALSRISDELEKLRRDYVTV